jgi:hypothetical protein
MALQVEQGVQVSAEHEKFLKSEGVTEEQIMESSGKLHLQGCLFFESKIKISSFFLPY